MGVTRMLVGAAALLGIATAGCSDGPAAPSQLPAVGPVATATGPEATGPDQSSQFGPSVLLKVPEDSAGPPYYSISANGAFIPRDGEWAAFPFLRELACVPDAQDLLAFPVFDAFDCDLTVEGHEHWQNGPQFDLAPRQTQFMGLGDVPIFFVHWTEVQAAMTGGLELGELKNLSSTVLGTAHFYKESNVLGISGPHGPGKGSYTISARGTLEDGGTFSLHVNEVLGQQRVVQIRLQFVN